MDVFDISTFSLLIIGGFLVTGAANGFNQVIEREHDKLMERTAVRPLPLGNLSATQAFIFSLIIGALGIFALNHINPQGSFWFNVKIGGFLFAFHGVVCVGLYTT